MKSQFVILGAIAATLVAISAAFTSAVAFDSTNSTITPANSTLFLESGANISQPGTPVLMPSENITTDNLTDSNNTGR